MLKHKSKRLPNNQAQKQEISYAQAQKKETSRETKLHWKMFKVEHLIYYQ